MQQALENATFHENAASFWKGRGVGSKTLVRP
jgi:hypothetical protein